MAIEMPERITGAWLNGLTAEHRIEVLKGPFGQRMHAWAASYVTFFRWSRDTGLGTTINNASVFFVELGGRLLAVTARHVLEGYREAKRRSRRIFCQIENIEFDPERRLWAERANIDIVTFDFTYEELRSIRKQALRPDPGSWPPPHPFTGQGAFLVGFPAKARLWTSWRSISFGLYSASPIITAATDQQIICRFERDYWIDSAGRGLPPKGYDLGGLSGGPLLMSMDVDGRWDFYLGGVISEARTSKDYETVVAVPAHFIAPDGTINSELSAPVRHAMPAT